MAVLEGCATLGATTVQHRYVFLIECEDCDVVSQGAINHFHLSSVCVLAVLGT